jgi:hypothetical protein
MLLAQQTVCKLLIQHLLQLPSFAAQLAGLLYDRATTPQLAWFGTFPVDASKSLYRPMLSQWVSAAAAAAATLSVGDTPYPVGLRPASWKQSPFRLIVGADHVCLLQISSASCQWLHQEQLGFF